MRIGSEVHNSRNRGNLSIGVKASHCKSRKWSRIEARLLAKDKTETSEEGGKVSLGGVQADRWVQYTGGAREGIGGWSFGFQLGRYILAHFRCGYRCALITGTPGPAGVRPGPRQGRTSQ
eukprot:766653-Hanusia_phi.AAC.1